jgi:DNA-binding SARP family transcriptional activator
LSHSARSSKQELIEFGILGPLEVVCQGHALEIGAGKQRTLLTVLLLHPNEVVSIDRLIDELWGERAPATAPKIVQGYVSQLRKVLAGETGRQDQARGRNILRTQPPGYVLQLEEGQLDADRFAALLAKARAASAAGAASDASTLLEKALALWRGPPLVDFTFERFAQEEIVRLEELHSAALEERIDADLALGRRGDLVAELEALVARHPLRERLRGQLMVALYRGGRQAEALQLYQETRRMLVEELGLEPSRRLQQLEQAILRQDSSLDLLPPPAAASSGEPRIAGRPAPLRWPGSVFVGRERELAVLLSALEDALSGRGRLLLVGGEPGIGKSRLAEELASRVVDSRAQVLWGRCWEAGGAPPYWPWVQAIRACVRHSSPDQLRAELGPGAAEIVDLVPEVRQRLPDVGEPSALADPQQDRFRLFDSITSFFKNVSRSRPLLLVLDDLNWADKGSLLLLEFVTRELADTHMLLIGTYRDIELTRRHPLSQTLAELTRESLCERVLLRGLSNADVERFIETTCGFAPHQALVRGVHTQTEGNPFFVSEVVRLLAEEGALTAEALGKPERWSARLPEGVRETIGRRLARLSEPCNETLTIASVIGREFALDQLGGLIDDLSEDRLLEVLEEALSAHIIEAAGVGRYQFTHALIQRTLADELSLTRRARLHARIAAALEELHGARADAHAAELAHHYAEAGTLLGPEKLVRYSLIAGESALAAYAPEQALVHFDRALAAREGQATDDETAELLFGRGRAQLATLPPDELEPAITSLRAAFEHYAGAGDIDRAVAVAAHPLPLSLRFRYTNAAQLIARALTLVPPASREAGGLLAEHGWFSGFIEGDYDGAQRAFQQALAIAEREDDPALERRTLANAAFVDAFHLRWQDCRTRGLRAIALTQHAGDLRTEILARRAVAFTFTSTGEGEQARLHTAAALAHAEHLRENWWLTSTTFSHELPCLYLGDWQAAREMSKLGLEAAPRDARHLALRAALEFELGDPDEGSMYIARLQEVAESAPPPGPIADYVFLGAIIPLTSRIAGAGERLDVAELAAERVLSLPRLSPALALYAKSGLALIAVQRSDADTAKGLYGALAAERGTASFFIPLTTDRLLGLLAVTFGQVDTALAHFEAGLAFCGRAGYRPECAWTASDYAEALLARGGPGDRDKAAALQDAALVTARELEMRPLMERILARQEVLKA